jgi:hypothetical protein
MGEPMGVGPWPPENKKSRPQINMLVDGKKTGKNFVNEFTFNYAKYRVENKQHNETIDEYRLFNNMLSSQPMAFNLFCPFIRMLKEGKEKVVTTIFKAIFPDKHIREVTTTEHEVASLKDELKPEYQYKISALSLEDFIERTFKVCPEGDKAPFLYFKERYIPYPL